MRAALAASLAVCVCKGHMTCCYLRNGPQNYAAGAPTRQKVHSDTGND
jgi:hypothetical protein